MEVGPLFSLLIEDSTPFLHSSGNIQVNSKYRILYRIQGLDIIHLNIHHCQSIQNCPYFQVRKEGLNLLNSLPREFVVVAVADIAFSASIHSSVSNIVLYLYLPIQGIFFLSSFDILFHFSPMCLRTSPKFKSGNCSLNKGRAS